LLTRHALLPLLIAPEGIEIELTEKIKRLEKELLIAPEGIEINLLNEAKPYKIIAFNRTRRN